MTNALVPTEQKSVLFYEDEVVAVQLEDGSIYVPIRPIVDGLGLNWSGQQQRINRDPVLSEVKGVCVIHTPGGPQDMLALPLEFLNGWLFGINANRVKSEFRDRIVRYQRECYQVLHEAFTEGRLTVDPTFSDLLQSDSPAAQAYRMAQAMMQLARQQLLLESRLESHDAQIIDHEQRLEDIEATLGSADRYVTPDQASQISQGVKTVALKLGKKSGRNEYGAVYGELYRKFGITSYKQLPAARFDEAMAWLNEWREHIEGDLPF